ncbi:MAG: branched-chain amino acid ABC transporter permease, partial [Rhizobiaceae bacterium]
MTISLALEQLLNGIQLGVMLFLMSAGLTLIFGVMGLINLAHGSLYMVGAFACAAVAALTGSFWLGLVASLACAAAAGAIVELLVIRRLYDRDHLDQVLATFALILIFSEGTRWLFGSFPLYLDIPPLLQGAVALPGDATYPVYRLAIIAVGALVALGLYLLIGKTRLGMRIRAGESDREMIGALGVDIRTLYTLVFALGSALAGLAGAIVGPLQSVQVGMGEPVLILAFVVIVIGGIGSIKGALVGALLVGITDTLGRLLLPQLLTLFMDPSQAGMIGGAAASMLIYVVMAVI